MIFTDIHSVNYCLLPSCFYVIVLQCGVSLLIKPCTVCIYIGSWTPQHASSATRGSLATVWRTFDMIFYTGWMYQNASHSSYAWPSIQCLHGMGPIYLSEMCRPSSSEAGRRHLRSANRGQLVVPRYRLKRRWRWKRGTGKLGTKFAGVKKAGQACMESEMTKNRNFSLIDNPVV